MEIISKRIEFLAQAKPRVSMREVCRRSQISSVGFLKFVLQRKRKLTLKVAKKLSEGLGFQSNESDYFLNLVQGCSTTPNDSIASQVQLEDAQLAYLSNWFIPVVRELLLLEDAKNDAAWICKNIRPKISVDQASMALKVIQTLDRVSTEKPLSTNDLVKAGLIQKFHSSILERAQTAAMALSPEERELGVLILTTNERKQTEMFEEIIKFRKYLFSKYAQVSPNDDRVCVVGLQVFPATQIVSKK